MMGSGEVMDIDWMPRGLGQGCFYLGSMEVLPVSILPVQLVLREKRTKKRKNSMIVPHISPAIFHFRNTSHPRLSLDPPKRLMPSEGTHSP